LTEFRKTLTTKGTKGHQGKIHEGKRPWAPESLMELLTWRLWILSFHLETELPAEISPRASRPKKSYSNTDGIEGRRVAQG